MTSVRQPKARPCDQFPAGSVDAKRARHVLVRAAVISNDRCGACGAVLPVEPWRIAEGVMPVCPPCGAARAPELAWAAKRLNRADAGELPTDLNIGIRYSAGVIDATCAKEGWLVTVERRTPIEIGRVGAGQRALLYSISAAEDAAPTLARALNEFYGSRPARRAKPAEPEPETAEQIAEQAAERERQARRDRAVTNLAIAIFGRMDVAADRDGCCRRASAAAAALSELFAVESSA